LLPLATERKITAELPFEVKSLLSNHQTMRQFTDEGWARREVKRQITIPE
jgi:hypothetical protein